VPNNIVLLPLAPYFPELNSMENVWEYLRGNKLSAGVWGSYEAIAEACAEAWNFFVTTQTASARSAPGTGRQSIFGAAGIICDQGQLFKVTRVKPALWRKPA
jgi:hypothetical protein